MNFETWLRENAGYSGLNPPTPKISREQLGGLLIDYVIEAAHNNWDGFSSRDKTGIRRLFDDMIAYHDAAVQSDPDYFKRNIFTGSATYPGLPRLER